MFLRVTGSWGDSPRVPGGGVALRAPTAPARKSVCWLTVCQPRSILVTSLSHLEMPPGLSLALGH